jgi:hypothetical protein
VRLLVLLVSALLLGACTNMVRSEAPWFGPADAAGAPPLRDGVWAAVDPECRFDASRPLEQWPGCAQGRVIRGGEELSLKVFDVEDARGRRTRTDYDWSSEAFVLAAGVPRIQQRACGEPRGLVEAAEGNAPELSALNEAVSRLVYCYAGLRAEALDAEDRIVAFTTWPVWCGPTPLRAEGEKGPNVTDAPFPGLTVVGEHCVAGDVAALRAAATASETLQAPDEPGEPLRHARFRWVRDGWR